jgi:peptidoglycan lytic transglycosylase G
VLVAAVVGVARGVQWVVSDLGSTTTAPAADPHGKPIPIVIPTGADASEIGAILEEQGVVEDGGRFREYAKDAGEGSEFKAGTYAMKAGTGYDALIRALDGGPVAVVKTLVVPEGYRISEIEDRLGSVGISKKAYARVVRAAAPPPGYGHHVNMEGFMFPATYSIRPGETSAALVAQQLAAFRDNVAKVDMSYAKSKNLTPYDVLTIASMIEREARAPGDRAKVAAVIYNRLHKGMSLGIDATILYHLGSWSATIHQSDIDDPEPYNTRTNPGLPPTPICNPGLASIEAAAHPAHVNYLYYVAVPGQDAQYFTASYEDFKSHGG